jgi:hypothetical protein
MRDLREAETYSVRFAITPTCEPLSGWSVTLSADTLGKGIISGALVILFVQEFAP